MRCKTARFLAVCFYISLFHSFLKEISQLNLFHLFLYFIPVSLHGKLMFVHYTIHSLTRKLIELKKMSNKNLIKKWRIKSVACEILEKKSTIFMKIIQNIKTFTKRVLKRYYDIKDEISNERKIYYEKKG